jgi:hypothetical protein
MRLHAGLEVRKSFWVRKTKWSGYLPIKAGFKCVKACLKVEDDLAMLNSNDASSGETSSITKAVYLIQDWCSWVTWAQEIGVERMNMSRIFIDCA